MAVPPPPTETLEGVGGGVTPYTGFGGEKSMPCKPAVGQTRFPRGAYGTS